MNATNCAGEDCGRPYPAKGHQRGMGCHIKLPVKAHLSLAQPHTHKSGMVACEERERGTIWTSPPMVRPIIEISKTCPDMDTHSEMR